MPVRQCQLCGMKAIVDESQASASPFLCAVCLKPGPKPTARPNPTPAPKPPDIVRPPSATTDLKRKIRAQMEAQKKQVESPPPAPPRNGPQKIIIRRPSVDAGCKIRLTDLAT